MRKDNEILFFTSILDSISEHIVVIDHNGDILYVNKSWQRFAQKNDCMNRGGWEGVNYLAACDYSALAGDDFGRRAAQGIRKIISSDTDLFYLEYPCHSPDEKRWFMMRVAQLKLPAENLYVISHQNITERILAEEHVLSLSRIDGLTKIANRRHFDTFLENEWSRCIRLNMPISIAFIDIDHFKELNDTHGHLFGDECLRVLAGTIQKFAKRPSDLCARYGGDELAIIFGNTTLEESETLINSLFSAVREIKFKNMPPKKAPQITVSIGLANVCPKKETNAEELIRAADTYLYTAKKNGRNRICSGRLNLDAG